MSEKLRVGILGATGMVGQLADVGKWILQCRKL